MDTLVIVTGGSAGIGRALLQAAPGGSHRVSVSRTAPDDPAISHVAADLAEPAAWPEVDRAIGRLVHERPWQRITCIQAAGTLTPLGYMGEVDAAALTRNVLLDGAAPLLLGHGFLAAVRHLDVRRELVLLSSGAARRDYPGWATYGAAKAGLDRWACTVAAEQADRGGVRVLSVTPGVVATGMQALIRSTPARDFPRVERFQRLHDEGALLDAGDVAEQLWTLLDDPTETGVVVDLRDR